MVSNPIAILLVLTTFLGTRRYDHQSPFEYSIEISKIDNRLQLIEHGRSFLSFLATVEPAELDKIGQRLLPHRIIVNQQAELQSASVTERNRTSAIHKGRHRRRTSGKWAQLVSSGRVGSSAETSTEVINQPNTTHQLQPHYSDPQRIYALGNPADSLAPMDPLSRGGEKIIGALLGPSSADRNSGEVEDSDFIQPDAQSISSMAPHSRYMKAFRLLESHYHTRVSKPLGYAEIVSVIKLGDFFFAEKPKAFLSSLQETHTGQTFWHSEFVRPSTDGPVTERLFSSFHCAEILEERSAGDPLRLRMTRVLLYHYFVQLCERSYLSNERRTVGKDKTSTVIDEILKEIYGSDLQEHGSESYKRRKTSIHRHKKIGKRWTLLVGFLGCGVLLLCSNSMSKQM
jgi:hypothetical protein